MVANSKRVQARKALFQSKASPSAQDTTSHLQSVMQSIEQIRQSPKGGRKRRRKLKDHSKIAIFPPDDLADLPLSAIDQDL